jgi:hypothetical protein
MCVWVRRFLVSDEQNDYTQELKKLRSHQAGGHDPIQFVLALENPDVSQSE